MVKNSKHFYIIEQDLYKDKRLFELDLCIFGHLNLLILLNKVIFFYLTSFFKQIFRMPINNIFQLFLGL